MPVHEPGPVSAPRVLDTTDDVFAARLRGFGPVGLLAILVIVLTGNIFVGEFLLPVSAVLVLVWVRLSRTPWADIGYARPRSWLYTVSVGIALGISLKLAMKAIVMPLLGADPINHAYSHLAGNRTLIPATLWSMLIVGFAEETTFRGFLFERLGRLLGRSVRTTVAIVLISSALFGAAHYTSQGTAGVQQAIVAGLVFGSMYAVTGNLWMPIVAHSAFDLAAYGIIYWNLEARLAHLVFG